ncbi:MAG: tetratricopeptide repeat protein [Nannocystaceae bacterium]
MQMIVDLSDPDGCDDGSLELVTPPLDLDESARRDACSRAWLVRGRWSPAATWPWSSPWRSRCCTRPRPRWPSLEAAAHGSLGMLHDRRGDFAAAQREHTEAYWVALAGGAPALAAVSADKIAFTLAVRLARPPTPCRGCGTRRSCWRPCRIRPACARPATRSSAAGSSTPPGISTQPRPATSARCPSANACSDPITPRSRRCSTTSATSTWSAVRPRARVRTTPARVRCCGRSTGPHTRTSARAWSTWPRSASATGDKRRAVALYEAALANLEAALGEVHPAVASNLNNLAMVLADTGETARAKAMYQRALSLAEQALGLEHPLLAHPLLGLGQLALREGDRPDGRTVASARSRFRSRDDRRRARAEAQCWWPRRCRPDRVARSLAEAALAGFRDEDPSAVAEITSLLARWDHEAAATARP